jgi:hypothetical protein
MISPDTFTGFEPVNEKLKTVDVNGKHIVIKVISDDQPEIKLAFRFGMKCT